MFDITADHRKAIYTWLARIASVLGAASVILTPIVAVIPEGGPLAAVATSVLAVVGLGAGYAGKLAADHTPIEEFLDAVDSVPGN